MINTVKLIIIVCLTICVIKINAQDKILIQQEDSYMLLSADNKMAKTTQLIDEPFYDKPNTIVYEPHKIGLVVESGKQFLRGLQVPRNNNVWYYCETENFTNQYKIFRYNETSDKKELVFDNSVTPAKHLTFLPFAFGADENTIYFNTGNIETLEENLGIWVYNKQQSTFTKIDIGNQYMSEPLVANDGKSLLFTETKAERDLIHGTAEILVSYELKNQSKTILHQSYGKQINLLGYLSTGNSKSAKGCEDESYDSGVVYKLPFKPGEEWCITRDGSPRPCPSSITEFCPQAHSSLHSYRALDIAHGDWSANNTNRPITAAADGKVVMTGLKGRCGGGYGLTVMIEHADGYLTLYAHLSEISVTNGEQVISGQTIGKEGGSGRLSNCQVNYTSYARHLHFETRRSVDGGSTGYVKFADIGNQTPRQNDVVRSGNVYNPNPEPEPSNSGNIAPSGSLFDVTTELNGAYGASKAFDGNTGTRWNSNGVDNFNYFVIQLDKDYAVNKFIVKHASSAGLSANLNTERYRIFYWNGSGWAETVNYNNTSKLGTTTHNVSVPITKWVALVVDDPTFTTDKYARIPEFEIYGTPVNGRFSNNNNQEPGILSLNNLNHLSASVNAHPNIITNGKVRFQVSNLSHQDQDTEIVINNATGKLIKKIGIINESSIKADLSNLPAGIYFYHLESKSGIISEVNKLLKQ